MDTLAHVLWSWAILRKSRQFWLVAASAALPDLLSFGPHLIGSIVNGGLRQGPPPLHTLSPYVFHTYDFTHSLIASVAVFGLVYLLIKRIPLWLWGWPIHILIDIPTHSMEFFPTPFLWPLSNYRFDGISWAMPWFSIVNYSLLAIAYVWLYTKNGINSKTHRARRRKNQA